MGIFPFFTHGPCYNHSLSAKGKYTPLTMTQKNAKVSLLFSIYLTHFCQDEPPCNFCGPSQRDLFPVLVHSEISKKKKKMKTEEYWWQTLNEIPNKIPDIIYNLGKKTTCQFISFGLTELGLSGFPSRAPPNQAGNYS